MADTATPDVAVDAVTREDLAAVRDEITRELVNFRTVDTAPANPLAKFRSKGELYHAIVQGSPPAREFAVRGELDGHAAVTHAQDPHHQHDGSDAAQVLGAGILDVGTALRHQQQALGQRKHEGSLS